MNCHKTGGFLLMITKLLEVALRLKCATLHAQFDVEELISIISFMNCIMF
jgi:hypothetical protein